MEAVIPALLVPGTHLSRTPLRLPQCDATQLKAPSSFRVDLLTKYCVVLISIYHFWLNSCFHIATCMIMSTSRDVTLPSRRTSAAASAASSHGRLPGGSGDRGGAARGWRSRGRRALWCWQSCSRGFISMIGASAFPESTVTASTHEPCMPERTSRAFAPPHKTTPTKRARPDTENLPSTVSYGCDMHSKECGVGDEMGLRWGKCL